ncbi:hypothetical protein AAE478_003405 [Parahypoxylon ruwenzoriense]
MEIWTTQGTPQDGPEVDFRAGRYAAPQRFKGHLRLLKLYAMDATNQQQQDPFESAIENEFPDIDDLLINDADLVNKD